MVVTKLRVLHGFFVPKNVIRVVSVKDIQVNLASCTTMITWIMVLGLVMFSEFENIDDLQM